MAQEIVERKCVSKGKMRLGTRGSNQNSTVDQVAARHSTKDTSAAHQVVLERNLFENSPSPRPHNPSQSMAFNSVAVIDNWESH